MAPVVTDLLQAQAEAQALAKTLFASFEEAGQGEKT